MELAGKLDLTVQQLDVKTAYVNAQIDYEGYLEQAVGYKVPGKDNEKLVINLTNHCTGFQLRLLPPSPPKRRLLPLKFPKNNRKNNRNNRLLF